MKQDITESNAKLLIDMIRRKAPEYLELLTCQKDEEFLSAMDALLGKAVDNLETNSKNFQNLDEVGFTGILKIALDIPGLEVTQETNSNGHVDITIVADHCVPARKILGEAKIYGGPANHIDGLEQLLGYLTGRELRGLLIFYHRKQDRKQGIATSVKILREELDVVHPCQQQGETRDHILKWSFFSTHIHSSGIEIEVGHIGCNL
jgi:hypothetical protein